MPGFSVHDELAILVDAGLTPPEALRTATSNPARFFNRPRQGTIKNGSIADLVVLEANPLDNIGNTKRINAVVLNGKYFKKENLVKMLGDVEGAVNRE